MQSRLLPATVFSRFYAQVLFSHFDCNNNGTLQLDEATKADMRAFTAAQIRNTALPTILVTHDPRDAEAMDARRFHLPPS